MVVKSDKHSLVKYTNLCLIHRTSADIKHTAELTRHRILYGCWKKYE